MQFLIFTVLIILLMLIYTRIIRRTLRKSLIEDIQKETASLIEKMNQATERNIYLIEKKINELKKYVDKADLSLKSIPKDIFQNIEKQKIQPMIQEVNGKLSKPESLRKVKRTEDQNLSIDKRDLQKEILDLHKKGFSTDAISSYLKYPKGEIELIVTLYKN